MSLCHESNPLNPKKGTCSEETGCCEGGLDRRRFIQFAGAGAAAFSAMGPSAVAGPFQKEDTADHFIPMDKKLNPVWVKGLFARGERTWYSGKDLETIGMPVGGICAGQVYLTGDGRIVYWDIFNQNINTGYGRINYKDGRKPVEVATPNDFIEAPEVDQGFAVQVKAGGKTLSRTLDIEGFRGLRFCGEYPLGFVEYRDKDFPVEVDLSAFSPFIPLNAADSALPASVLRYTIRNTSDDDAIVTLAGWLLNAVCHYSAKDLGHTLVRRNKVFETPGWAGVVSSAGIKERQPGEIRPPEVFADFEAEGYGKWSKEGEAFGEKPAGGTLENQQHVSGFKGKGLVNTFLGGDKPTGKLTSPAFRIDRPYIGFLIGGGSHKETICINLVVDGKVVRTASGKDNERLLPFNWDVKDLAGKEARIEIKDEATGAWGHINIDQIEFRDEPMTREIGDFKKLPDYGTMALAVLGEGESRLEADAVGGVFKNGILSIDEADSNSDTPLYGTVDRTVSVAPGEEKTITFVVSWCMPNMYRGSQWVGNYYGKRFQGAGAVVDYVAANLDRLAGQTRLWHRTFYDSTLPRWLLDRLHSTVCNLATTTCQWWRNGRFWAFEGCGCCHGTCGHVWNYEHAMARLFPELERSAREMQDFAPGVGLVAETGEIHFRGEGGIWAGDSQGGYLLKAFREHQCSADDGFLNRNWRQIKKAMEFLIEQDGDADGLIEGKQHNTYDIEYYGPNTMVGSLYLGALRAAEEMAREVGDSSFADNCRKIFEAGRKNTVERLFNGEYFIQEVDLKEHPDWQYGEGCLADQLFGQGWAHQVGLGYVYPEDTVRKALDSIWKYCWAPDVALQNEKHKPERWFAVPGEAGLLTCTWPKGKHMGPRSTRYRDEVWTGIEYQVANHMAWEGMLTETLAMCRAIHERYHPSKRNPFNEIECGDHYARALASWGVLIGLAGFEYHGPKGRIGFAPRITPEDFRSVFTAAEGWGTISQQQKPEAQVNTIRVEWGRVPVKELSLTLQAWKEAKRVLLNGKDLGGKASQEESRIQIVLPKEMVLEAGEAIQVDVEFS